MVLKIRHFLYETIGISFYDESSRQNGKPEKIKYLNLKTELDGTQYLKFDLPRQGKRREDWGIRKISYLLSSDNFQDN